MFHTESNVIFILTENKDIRQIKHDVQGDYVRNNQYVKTIVNTH